MNGTQWKLPLNLAIGFHLLIGVSVLYLPGLFESKPRFEDIYTVNFVNLEEALPSEPAPSEQQPVQEPQPEPPAPEPVVKDAVSIAEPSPAPEPVAAPPKAISIKPLKKKKKKKIAQPQRDNQEAIKKQRIAEMQRAQREAEEQAKILAEEAERQRKMLENTRASFKKPPPSPSPAQGTGRGSGSPGSAVTSIETRYYASIAAKLQPLWSLPEYKQWDPNLQARVVITIRKNGEIADSFFEAKSGDMIFDKFVVKTINDVGSLPPIPPVLKKQRMEIGLVFSPGKIR